MVKTLSDIPSQAEVMVDANIIIYGLFSEAPHHKSCYEFLERGMRQDLQLHVTVSIAAEIIHRAMVLEAIAQSLVQKSSDIAPHLKRHPQVVRQLTLYKAILRDLTESRVNILPLTYRDLHTSKQYRDNYGLLTNDSLILAVMQREGISYLATNDSDFERVPQIAVRQPD